MASFRLFLSIILSFLGAFTLEILPYSVKFIWVKPDWVLLLLVFWIISFPDYVGIICAFIVGLWMDLSMGTLLGTHAAAFVVIAYLVLRFHMRIWLFPAWKQLMLLFILALGYHIFLSWISGMVGGYRAEGFFWLPAATTTLTWPFLNMVMKYSLKGTEKTLGRKIR